MIWGEKEGAEPSCSGVMVPTGAAQRSSHLSAVPWTSLGTSSSSQLQLLAEAVCTSKPLLGLGNLKRLKSQKKMDNQKHCLY